VQSAALAVLREHAAMRPLALTFRRPNVPKQQRAAESAPGSPSPFFETRPRLDSGVERMVAKHKEPVQESEFVKARAGLRQAMQERKPTEPTGDG